MEGGRISGSSLIEGYLRELAGELRLPRRTRERVLAEVTDHLTTAIEHGESDRAAISAFGSPREVARSFSEELSVAQARRATWLTASVTVLFCALIALDAPWRSSALGRVFGALSVFTVQIAFTCAALSVVRAVRHRRDRALPAGKLRWILRGDAVALGCALLTATTGVAAVLVSAHPSEHTGVLVRAAAIIALAVPVLVALARGRSRVQGLAVFADQPAAPGDDALADVMALLGTGHALLGTGHALLGTGQRWASLLRAHAWRGAIALAVIAGGVLGLGHALSEGGPPSLDALPRAGAAFAILLVIEASAVLACFAVLGGFLGIRRSRHDTPGLSATPR